MPRFEVAPEHAGERLDKLLARLMPEVSRSTLQRWIAEGRVLVGGRACRARDPVRTGTQIEVEPAPASASTLQPEPDVAYRVVFEDEHLIVIDKPAGLVVHPARGHRTGTLVGGLLARPGFERVPSDARDREGAARPGIVHRIDKDTSGLLVVAKDEPTREGLKSQLAAHTMERSYLALTVGVPRPGRIESLHGRDPRSRLRFTTQVREGRRAVTNVELLESLAGGRAALVRCRLETGRTHQIRVHLKEKTKTPILGDALYGRRSADEVIQATADELGRQALHAATLGFVHPASHAMLSFDAPLPGDMQRALERLRSAGSR
jgi:23S rRNA pseudouridine1911/1915/1917 synthase